MKELSTGIWNESDALIKRELIFFFWKKYAVPSSPILQKWVSMWNWWVKTHIIFANCFVLLCRCCWCCLFIPVGSELYFMCGVLPRLRSLLTYLTSWKSLSANTIMYTHAHTHTQSHRSLLYPHRKLITVVYSIIWLHFPSSISFQLL